jgi:hypothetical protein
VFVQLTELGLVFGDRDTCAVEDDESSTRRTLVNGTDEPILQITRDLVLILQQRTISIILLFWSVVQTRTSMLPALLVVANMVFRLLEVLWGL